MTTLAGIRTTLLARKTIAAILLSLAALATMAAPAGAQSTVDYGEADATTIASNAAYLGMGEQEFVDASVEVHHFLLAISGKVGTEDCSLTITNLPSGDYHYDIPTDGVAITAIADRYCWDMRTSTYASVALLSFLTSLSASQAGATIPTVAPQAQGEGAGVPLEDVPEIIIGGGDAPPSNVPQPSLEIENLRVEDLTSTTATLRWNTEACAGATLMLDNGGGTWQDGFPNENECWSNHFIKLGQAPFNTTTSIQPDTTYTATIEVTDVNGSTDSRVISFTTPAAGPTTTCEITPIRYTYVELRMQYSEVSTCTPAEFAAFATNHCGVIGSYSTNLLTAGGPENPLTATFKCFYAREVAGHHIGNCSGDGAEMDACIQECMDDYHLVGWEEHLSCVDTFAGLGGDVYCAQSARLTWSSTKGVHCTGPWDDWFDCTVDGYTEVFAVGCVRRGVGS